MNTVPQLPEEYRFSGRVGNSTHIHTFMVPMRDGVELETVLITQDPNILRSYSDSSVEPRKVVYERSPYNLMMTFSESDSFVVNYGYISIIQSFRGRHGSQGEYQLFDTEGRDSHDTRQWIIKQPWCEGGHVLSYGISADGISAALSIIEPHDEITTGFYALATGNIHQLIQSGGAVKYSLFHGWLNSLKEGEWFNTTMDNFDYYDNSYYDHRSIYKKLDATDVAHPAIFWSGWYDIMQSSTIGLYEEFKAALDEPENPRILVVEPYGHCQFLKPFMPFGHAMDIPMFEGAVTLNNNKIAGKITELPVTLSSGQILDKLNLFVMDGIQSYWTSIPDWPAFNPFSYYLNANGALGTGRNTEKDTTSYIYDPSDPTPTAGGNNLLIKCGPEDQNEVDKHSGVITFETPILENDVVVCGHMQAELYVSTNCTDTDFMVKIEDASSWDSALLMDGAVNMQWRKGPEVPPSIVTPNEIYKVVVDLWHTCKVFEAGHKIRVAIQSSNYPRFMLSPNNGLPVNVTGPALIAENTIHYGPDHPSRLILPIVDIADLPDNHHFLQP